MRATIGLVSFLLYIMAGAFDPGPAAPRFRGGGGGGDGSAEQTNKQIEDWNHDEPSERVKELENQVKKLETEVVEKAKLQQDRVADLTAKLEVEVSEKAELQNERDELRRLLLSSSKAGGGGGNAKLEPEIGDLKTGYPMLEAGSDDLNDAVVKLGAENRGLTGEQQQGSARVASSSSSSSSGKEPQQVLSPQQSHRRRRRSSSSSSKTDVGRHKALLLRDHRHRLLRSSNKATGGALARRTAVESKQVAAASELSVALTQHRRLTTTVSTESEFSAAIASDTTIVLQNDITLSAAGSTSSKFTISGVTGLVIDGAGYKLGFGSSDSGNGRIFYIDSSSSVEMKDLTLENGYLYSTSSSVHGGAIYITGSSTLEMTSCALSGHTAEANPGRGGAIYSYSSTVTLTSCTLSGNTALYYGGAIYSWSSTVTLTSCTLSSNTASEYGGAIYMYLGSVACTGCYFVSNTASTQGGDAYISSTTFSTAPCTEYSVDHGALDTAGKSGTYTNYECMYPTAVPTISPLPSRQPSSLPTLPPTAIPTALPSLVPTPLPTPLPTLLMQVTALQQGSYQCSVDTVTVTWNMDLPNPSTHCGTMSVTLIAEGGTTTTIDATKVLASGPNSASWLPDANAAYCPGTANRIRLSCSVDSQDTNYGPYFTTYFNLTSSVSSCPAGQYLNGKACSPCLAGTYSLDGAVTCSICGDGDYTPNSGSSSCSQCPSGKFLSDNGNLAAFHDSIDDCSACEAGKISESGSTICTACDTGRSSLTAASNCTICDTGYFLDETMPALSTGSCRECPPSKRVACMRTGERLTKLKIKPGYYRISDIAWNWKGDDEIRPCPMKENACAGGRNFTDSLKSYCHKGYEGPLCEVCSRDYFKDSASNTCTECDDSSLVPSLVFVLIAGLLVIAAYWYCFHGNHGAALFKHKKGASAGQEQGTAPAGGAPVTTVEDGMLHELDSANEANEARSSHPVHKQPALERTIMTQLKSKVRILITFCQLISSIGFNLNIQFPSEYAAFLRSLSVAGLDLFQFLPLSCVFETNFYSHLLTLTLSPLILVLLLIVGYCTCANGKQKDLCFSVILNTMYFVLPTCSSIVLTMFKIDCFNGSRENKTCYMMADYSIVHSVNGEVGESRSFWIAYAGAMMLVYPFGIPFAFAVLLYRKRRQLCPALQSTDVDPVRYLFQRTPKWGEKESSAEGSGDGRGNAQDEHDGQDQERERESEDADAGNASHIEARKQLEVLVGHYEPRAFWFEVMECIRRLALSSLLILIRDGSAAQTVVALFICLGTMRIYAYFTPYAERDDDVLTEVTQWQLYFAFFAALMIRVDAAPDRRREERIFSALLIVSSCAAFVFVGLNYLLVFMNIRKRVATYAMDRVEKAGSKSLGLDEKDEEGEGAVGREEGEEESRYAGGREMVNTDEEGGDPGDGEDPETQEEGIIFGQAPFAPVVCGSHAETSVLGVDLGTLSNREPDLEA